jgi:hypothetical protein
MESPFHQLLNPCIAGTRSQRWVPLESRRTWPAHAQLNAEELDMHGKIYIMCFLIQDFANNLLV